jgi:glycosyltransferase involved in cell wall biosynthesis
MQPDIQAQSPNRTQRVAFVYPPLFKYRVAFHEKVRRLLSEQNVEYRLLYCDPPPELKSRNDTCDIPWATKTPVRYFKGRLRGLIFQRGADQLRNTDLIVMQQENKLLLNYYVHLLRLVGAAKIAYFGHGRNFQALDRLSMSERFKRLMATRVDWWFAYNEVSAKIVEGYGFPKNRITSVNNSIDISGLQLEISDMSAAELDNRRRALGLKGQHVGIYIGGLYKEKQIAFLIEAAKKIRAQIPDFELIVVGGGPDVKIVTDAAKRFDFIYYVGPQHGRGKTELALLSSVFLLPGAVGLAVLDAFAYGVPLVTTAGAYHGPEIAYLKSGVNGVIVDNSSDVLDYATTVVELFKDEELRKRLAATARSDADRYSINSMADRFVDGVLLALASG